MNIGTLHKSNIN